MTIIKFKRLLRTRHTTTNGGLALIRHVLNDYAPLDIIREKCDKKLFGISLVSVLLAMVFRSLLKESKMRDFERKWNNDTTLRIFAGYRKELTHALLTRNIMRFRAKITRQIFMGMIKNLHSIGKVNLKCVAIDSTKIIAEGRKYQKTGLTITKGKVTRGYKLHLMFDITAKLPIAYIVTPINTHDSRMLEDLVKMVERHYGASLQELVIDRGYYGVKFFQFLKDRNIKFIIPAKRFSAMKEAFAQAKFEEFKPMKGGNIYYKDATLNLKKYGTIRCIMVANTKFEDWMPEEAKKKIFWALLTTNNSLSPVNIIKHYRSRWQIEVFFRSCRQKLGLNDLPGYDCRIVITHIGSVMLAYTALVVCVLKDGDDNEIPTIKLTIWKNNFIHFKATCEIHGITINYFFQEKTWLFTHLETFCPEGGFKI